MRIVWYYIKDIDLLSIMGLITFLSVLYIGGWYHLLRKKQNKKKPNWMLLIIGYLLVGMGIVAFSFPLLLGFIQDNTVLVFKSIGCIIVGCGFWIQRRAFEKWKDRSQS